jgi:hypothetical protein
MAGTKTTQEQEKDVEMAREDYNYEESEDWKTSNREPYHRQIFRRQILDTPLIRWLNIQFCGGVTAIKFLVVLTFFLIVWLDYLLPTVASYFLRFCGAVLFSIFLFLWVKQRQLTNLNRTL